MFLPPGEDQFTIWHYVESLDPVYQDNCSSYVDFSPNPCPSKEEIITYTIGLSGVSGGENNNSGVSVCFEFTDPNLTSEFPIIIDYGDGSPPEGIYSLNEFFCHDYEECGVYEVCISYYEGIIHEGKYITCCYTIDISCCDDADFDFDLVLGSTSCFNPYYSVTPHCTKDLPNEHKWIFEDGRVFYGLTPPLPIMFADFVNDDGQVCITHQVICCGDTLEQTKCVDYPNFAVLGRPGEERRLTDILVTGQTVYDFILENMSNPAIPLVIEGDLILDINSVFSNGSWYMGEETVVRNLEKSNVLYNMKIQNIGRLPNINCCYWTGFESIGQTVFRWDKSEISDALFTLNYPTRTAIKNPFLWMTDNLIHTNFFGIKSKGQDVNVIRFNGNEFIGHHEDYKIPFCECSAINAIDFRNVSAFQTVVFPNSGATNIIRNYEHGFHLEDLSAKLRNFKILDLFDHPAPPTKYLALQPFNQEDAKGTGIHPSF